MPFTPDPTRSKYFCVLPWIHMRVNQDGKLFPCCRVDEEFAYGSLARDSLAETWTGAKIREMRKATLGDRPISQCDYCYKTEAAGGRSWREDANTRFSAEVDSIRAALREGKLPDTKLRHIDLRFSNACNFRCRSCGPEKSSSWYADARKLVRDADFHYKKVIRPTESADGLMRELAPFLADLETIYFAGGEPLLEEAHQRFLAHLIAEGLTRIRLEYNTNFSFPLRRGERVLELWKHFPKLKVSASLDGVGEQGELLRKGMRWTEVEENFRVLKQEVPQAEFEIFPTITVMNAFHITTAIQRFIELEMLTRPRQLQFNIAGGPPHLNINIFNESERAALHTHYRTFVAGLRRDGETEWANHVEKELGLVLASLSPRVAREHRAMFRRYTIQLDRIRGERSIALFPELFGLLYGEEPQCHA